MGNTRGQERWKLRLGQNTQLRNSCRVSLLGAGRSVTVEKILGARHHCNEKSTRDKGNSCKTCCIWTLNLNGASGGPGKRCRRLRVIGGKQSFPGLNVIKRRHKKSPVNTTCKVLPKWIHSSSGRTRINTLGLTDCISHYPRALKTRVNELQVCFVADLAKQIKGMHSPF